MEQALRAGCCHARVLQIGISHVGNRFEKKLSKEFKLNPDKLPTIPDILPANMSKIALNTKYGQWDRQQLITAIQTHIYSGHTIYTFLNKENSLAVIHELLLICTEIKIIKLLQRYSRILQNDSHLTKIARKKLARVVREYFPLNIIRKHIQNRAMQIHLTES